MNEQFRIAQKLGLMFRADTPLPEDLKGWAISQLHSKSPALGFKMVSRGTNTPIEEWPRKLQPSLNERVQMWRTFWINEDLARAKKDGQDSASKRNENRKNLWGERDELKFVHRNIYGEDQLRLRFMAFWTNHFTTGNIFDNINTIGHAMDTVVLANLNNSFSDMLFKSTTHPSMLTYLDNIWSSGENSAEAKDARENNFQAGLNDNLGRELLELHSVSPSAKYTEKDIRNAANVLAGWGIELKRTDEWMRSQGADTSNYANLFKKRWAEPGVKNVMGKVINQGKGGLRELTDFLASHDHTIKHLSTKLAQHFVSDNPSSSDITYIENAWRKGNGDLDKIHTAVIERAILSKEPKFQWPMTWLFQTLRLSGATFVHGWDDLNQERNIFNRLMRVDKIFVELGQSFWSSRQPDGYSSNKTEWISGEMFERRIRFSEAIYKAGKPQYKANQIMDRIDAGAPTRKLVDGFRNEQEKFIALMCSPELMGLENV